MKRRLLLAALLLAACEPSAPAPAGVTTTTGAPTTTVAAVAETTTTAAPATTVATTATVATVPRTTTTVAVTEPAATSPPPAAEPEYDCPPDPQIAGVEYRCYPGAAYLPTTGRYHRGVWCFRYPGVCPNGEYIAVDPVRGDPYCSLKNELYNREHRGEFDPHGACPPK